MYPNGWETPTLLVRCLMQGKIMDVLMIAVRVYATAAASQLRGKWWRFALSPLDMTKVWESQMGFVPHATEMPEKTWLELGPSSTPMSQGHLCNGPVEWTMRGRYAITSLWTLKTIVTASSVTPTPLFGVMYPNGCVIRNSHWIMWVGGMHYAEGYATTKGFCLRDCESACCQI